MNIKNEIIKQIKPGGQIYFKLKKLCCYNNIDMDGIFKYRCISYHFNDGKQKLIIGINRYIENSIEKYKDGTDVYRLIDNYIYSKIFDILLKQYKINKIPVKSLPNKYYGLGLGKQLW